MFKIKPTTNALAIAIVLLSMGGGWMLTGMSGKLDWIGSLVVKMEEHQLYHDRFHENLEISIDRIERRLSSLERHAMGRVDSGLQVGGASGAAAVVAGGGDSE